MSYSRTIANIWWRFTSRYATTNTCNKPPIDAIITPAFSESFHELFVAASCTTPGDGGVNVSDNGGDDAGEIAIGGGGGEISPRGGGGGGRGRGGAGGLEVLFPADGGASAVSGGTIYCAGEGVSLRAAGAGAGALV